MNPEGPNPYKYEKRPEVIKRTAELLLPHHPKFEAAIQKLAIDPNDFRKGDPPYDPAVIDGHLAYVERRKADFAARDGEIKDIELGLTQGDLRKLAEILEYQIIKGVNIDEWIPHFKAIKTSEYDDIANGIDVILEFIRGTQAGHFGLAVDVSFSKSVDYKFDGIRDEILAFDGEENVLGKAVYFKSPATGYKGSLTGIPRVVAALDISVMQDLAKKSKSKSAGQMARLSVMSSIERQLLTFHNFAVEHKPECAPNYERAYNLIRAINGLMETDKLLEESGYARNSVIEESVTRSLKKFE